MMSSNRSVAGFNLIWLWDRIDRLAALYDGVAAALPDPPLVGRTVPFAEAPAALRWMKSGQSVGKVVLDVPGVTGLAGRPCRATAPAGPRRQEPPSPSGASVAPPGPPPA